MKSLARVQSIPQNVSTNEYVVAYILRTMVPWKFTNGEVKLRVSNMSLCKICDKLLLNWHNQRDYSNRQVKPC